MFGLFILLIWAILFWISVAWGSMGGKLIGLFWLFFVHLNTGFVEFITILYYLPYALFTWELVLRLNSLLTLLFPQLLENLNVCFFERVWISFDVLYFDHFCVRRTAIIHIFYYLFVYGLLVYCASLGHCLLWYSFWWQFLRWFGFRFMLRNTNFLCRLTLILVDNYLKLNLLSTLAIIFQIYTHLLLLISVTLTLFACIATLFS